MPRSEDVLTIFLASPGDVQDERSRMAEVVTDWNRAWSRDLGLRLELLRWEDDAYPDIGDDAQAVINSQIPSDWDLFVGIMWSRFGTPTSRSGSGTEEEFERGLDRHKTDPENVRLLFYFKEAPVAPSKIDTDQLKRVQTFKASAKSRGLLTWEFSDTDQFEKLISLHITKHVQDWRKQRDFDQPSSSTAQATPRAVTIQVESHLPVQVPGAITDDFGYLDLLELFNERSAEMGEIANRLSAAQQELTEKSTKGREELDAMNADPANLSVKKARSSIARVADEMLRFTERVEIEIPLFRASVDASMSALIRVATITAELYPEKIAETKSAAVQLLATLIEARQSTEGFKESTASLPRMTKELNLAKRKQVGALTGLIAEFENGERLLTEGLTVLDGLQG